MHIIDQILSIEISIKYYDNPYTEGCPDRLYIVPDDKYGSTLEIGFDESKVYWDFELEINKLVFPNSTENFHEDNDFGPYFRKLYSEFKSQINEKSNKDDFEDYIFKIKEYIGLFDKQLAPGAEIQSPIYMLVNPEIHVNVSTIDKHVAGWFPQYQISKFLEIQKKYLDYTLSYLENLSDQSIEEAGANTINLGLVWKATDTDLLELIVGLIETNSVATQDKIISRKELVKSFEQIFSIELKDFESKLSRATERKKDTSPYLTKLKQSFDNYCERKIDRQE